MKRFDIVQKCLDRTGRGNYLEIGVRTGRSLVPISAKRKWGVDPVIRFAKNPIRNYIRRMRFEWHAQVKLFEMTSDHFFGVKKGLLDRHRIDVAFIDGLHTYEQSLRDVEHSLAYLKEGGFIVLHDCSPTTAAMACPAKSEKDASLKRLPGWTGEWCGDVWKTIVYLRSHCADLKVCVIDCDYGVGIVKKGKSESTLDLSVAHIQKMNFEDLNSRRVELLNLKPVSAVDKFIES